MRTSSHRKAVLSHIFVILVCFLRLNDLTAYAASSSSNETETLTAALTITPITVLTSEGITELTSAMIKDNTSLSLGVTSISSETAATKIDSKSQTYTIRSIDTSTTTDTEISAIIKAHQTADAITANKPVTSTYTSSTSTGTATDSYTSTMSDTTSKIADNIIIKDTTISPAHQTNTDVNELYTLSLIDETINNATMADSSLNLGTIDTSVIAPSDTTFIQTNTDSEPRLTQSYSVSDMPLPETKATYELLITANTLIDTVSSINVTTMTANTDIETEPIVTSVTTTNAESEITEKPITPIELSVLGVLTKTNLQDLSTEMSMLQRNTITQTESNSVESMLYTTSNDSIIIPLQSLSTETKVECKSNTCTISDTSTKTMTTDINISSTVLHTVKGTTVTNVSPVTHTDTVKDFTDTIVSPVTVTDTDRDTTATNVSPITITDTDKDFTATIVSPVTVTDTDIDTTATIVSPVTVTATDIDTTATIVSPVTVTGTDKDTTATIVSPVTVTATDIDTTATIVSPVTVTATDIDTTATIVSPVTVTGTDKDTTATIVSPVTVTATDIDITATIVSPVTVTATDIDTTATIVSPVTVTGTDKDTTATIVSPVTVTATDKDTTATVVSPVTVTATDIDTTATIVSPVTVTGTDKDTTATIVSPVTVTATDIDTTATIVSPVTVTGTVKDITTTIVSSVTITDTDKDTTATIVSPVTLTDTVKDITTTIVSSVTVADTDKDTTATNVSPFTITDTDKDTTPTIVSPVTLTDTVKDITATSVLPVTTTDTITDVTASVVSLATVTDTVKDAVVSIVSHATVTDTHKDTTATIVSPATVTDTVKDATVSVVSPATVTDTFKDTAANIISHATASDTVKDATSYIVSPATVTGTVKDTTTTIVSPAAFTDTVKDATSSIVSPLTVTDTVKDTIATTASPATVTDTFKDTTANIISHATATDTVKDATASIVSPATVTDTVKGATSSIGSPATVTDTVKDAIFTSVSPVTVTDTVKDATSSVVSPATVTDTVKDTTATIINISSDNIISTEPASTEQSATLAMLSSSTIDTVIASAATLQHSSSEIDIVMSSSNLLYDLQSIIETISSLSLDLLEGCLFDNTALYLPETSETPPQLVSSVCRRIIHPVPSSAISEPQTSFSSEWVSDRDISETSLLPLTTNENIPIPLNLTELTSLNSFGSNTDFTTDKTHISYEQKSVTLATSAAPNYALGNEISATSTDLTPSIGIAFTTETSITVDHHQSLYEQSYYGTVLETSYATVGEIILETTAAATPVLVITGEISSLSSISAVTAEGTSTEAGLTETVTAEGTSTEAGLTETVTFSVSSTDDSISTSVLQTMTEPPLETVNVSRLSLRPETPDPLVIEPGDILRIQLQYNISVEKYAKLALSGSLDSGFCIPGTLNETLKTGVIEINSSILNNNYGNHSFVVTLVTSKGTNMSLTVFLLYEERVKGLNIQTDNVYVVVGQPFILNATLTSGSNVQLQWITNDLTCVYASVGNLRQANLTVVFEQSSNNTILVLAWNSISNTSAIINLTAQYEVTGFKIKANESNVHSSGVAELTVSLDPSANLSMGNVFMDIFYGDGQNQSIYLSPLMDILKGNGYAITHKYQAQGRYTVKARVYAEINSLSLEDKTFSVWDELSVSLDSNKEELRVGENIKFSFINPPVSAFRYNISFGDGFTMVSAMNNLTDPFDNVSITYNYSSPGVYNYRFYAWNPLYYSWNTITFTIQYPLIDSNIALQISSAIVPFPNSFFSLNMTLLFDPVPSDVTCNFNNGEKIEPNIPTFRDVYSIVKNYTYKSDGLKTIAIYCSNLVSSVNKTAVVSVINAPLVMETDNATVGRLEDKHFSIRLKFEFSHSIKDVVLRIEFGDGNGTVIILDTHESKIRGSGLTISHSYDTQGNYLVTSCMSSGENHLQMENITVHVWDKLNTTLSASALYVATLDVISFTFLNPPISGFEYTIDYGDGKSDTNEPGILKQSYTQKLITHRYESPGIYDILMKANNLFYSKMNYMQISVQYPIPNVSLTTDEKFVPYPGSTVNLTLSMYENSPSPTNVTCIFDYGDNETTEEAVTIRFDTPIVKEHSYALPGEKHVNFTCMNLISSISVNTTVFAVPFFIEILVPTIPIETEDFVNIRLHMQKQDLNFKNVKLEVNFGDGNVSVLGIKDIESNLTSDGYPIGHKYSVQGNYTIRTRIFGKQSVDMNDTYVYIWDVISTTLTANVIHAKVNEDIEFMFHNPPKAGFRYVIRYGDGTLHLNHENEFYSRFKEPFLKHRYNTSGVYDITMIAWNPFYFSTNELVLTIQYPIPSNLSLDPLTDEIPIPGSDITFTMEVLADVTPPTNVSCTFDFGETAEESVPTNLIFGIPIIKYYEYKENGTKNVNFSCYNFVSYSQLLATISVRSFVLSDFKVHYRDKWKMNMTRDGERVFPSKNQTVDFRISLFQCSKLPPNITFQWDLGDGTNEDAFPLVSFYRNHTYRARGNFTITIHMTSPEETYVHQSKIQMGIVQFFVNTYYGVINYTEFRFGAVGIGDGENYIFDIDHGGKQFSTKDTGDKIFSHVYNAIGEYFPFVIGTNDTFYEKVYLEHPVKNDYSIKEMNATLSNDSILLPPGQINITVYLPITSAAKTLLTCEIDMGDKIDRTLYIEKHNITRGDPYIFTYDYLTMGTQKINLLCQNLIESFQMNNTEVVVFNPCFADRGMFDRQYSNCTTPLRMYTSKDVDLSSRMPVKCVENNPTYIWKIYYINDTITCKHHPQEVPYTIFGTPTGTFRFRKGTMTPGVFKVSLMVDLQDTWAYEYTYVMFERTAPHAMIVGGFKIYEQRKELVIDALTESYNYEQGYGSNEDLTFTWGCFKYNESFMGGETIDELFTTRGGMDYFVNASFYNPNVTHENDVPCDSEGSGNLRNSSHGLAYLDAGTFEYSHYIVCVMVTLELADPSFFCQRITIVQGERPAVKIGCKVNCREKVAILSQLSVEGICTDCSAFEYGLNDFTWSWSLQLWTGAISGYQVITDLQNMTKTGINLAPFILKEKTLLEGKTYLLGVSLSMPLTRKEPGTAVMLINTNYLPYGGSCHVNTNEGNATTTLFVIDCNNWKDEGTRELRKNALDKLEPLTYEYVLERPTTYQNKDIVEKIPLFFASERSASELLLPMGDEKHGYEMTISVKVIDIFGDYAVDTSQTIKVRPGVSMQMKDENDIEAYQNIVDAYNTTFPQIKASGNKIAVIRYVGAAASLITNTNISRANDSIVYDMRNLTRTFITVFHEAMINQNNSGEVPNAGDSNNVIQNVKVCMKNTELVDSEATQLAVETVNTLTYNMAKKSVEEPYPTEDMYNIQQSSNAALDILDAAIVSAIPDEMEDISKDPTLLEIEEELRFKGILTDGQNDTTSNEIIQAEYDRQMEIRNLYKQKMKYGNSTMPSMVGALENMLDIEAATALTNEPERVLERDNVRLTLEKTSVNSLLNQTEINKQYMKIQFSNMTNSTDNMILRTAVFKKQPYFYGNGADKLTSKGILISLTNETKKENISLTVKVMNEATATFRRYQPTYIPADPQKRLYFKMNVRDTNDATIVYIKPDGIDFSNYLSFGLYDVFMTSVEDRFNTESKDVFKYEMDVRDWESSETGFKIVIPETVLPAGEAYIVLRPLKAPAQPVNIPGYRRKRSAENITASSNTSTTITFETTEANFSLIIMTTGCRTWSEVEQAWVATGCTVLPFSTLNETVCRCSEPQGQMFATTFYVPPNTIDFSGVWSKFDASNASVYGTIIALFVIYIFVFIWARRKDKQDIMLWATRFLCDNDKEDDYFYLLTVTTGMIRGAGTNSSIHFVLGGEAQDSGVRILNDGTNKEFPTGSEQKFFMGTNKSLGNLMYMRIWHDNSGTGLKKSWFLKQIVIDDLQRNDRYVFVCDRWLATNHDDGLLERQLTVSSKDDLERFQSLFSHHARFNLWENHIWLSLVLRPNKSSFNRIQRLTCIMALLFLTMISNAMFFRTDDEVQADTITLGSIKFSLQSLYISVVGILLTATPIFLLTLIFRNTKPKSIRRQKPIRKNDIVFEESGLKTQRQDLSDEAFYNADHYIFPHWISYIALVVTILAVIVPAFFLILYSMDWGKDKSEKWLIAFVLSFVESLFVLDPVKVVLIAVLMAMLLKKSTYRPEQNVKLNEVRYAALQFDGASARRYRTFRMDVLTGNETLSEDMINNQKLRREQEIKAQEALVEIMLYILFCFIIYSIGYINRDERAFFMKDNLYKSLYESSKYQFGFNKVDSYENYMRWLRETLFPKYYPETDYSGKALNVRDKMFFVDLENARIGPARFRQVRMNKESCPYSLLNGNRYCVPDYGAENQEEGSFCSYWRPYNKSCVESTYSFTSDSWNFKSSSEIWGLTMIGDYGTYDGGGFILQLDSGLDQSLLILQQLEDNHWIDRRTRAVFLEFTLYNANTNLFAYAVFLAEFTVCGGVVTWADIQSFRPYQHTGAMGAYAIVCYFFFIIVVLFGTVKILGKIKKLGFRYFMNSWRLVDILCLCLSFVGISMWVLRLHYAQQSMAVYYNDKNTFINFQHVVVWDYVFNVVVGILIFISTVRLLRILGYNKRMTQLALVVVSAGGELLGFSVVFGIVFLAYVFLGYLIFGIHMREYRSLFTTLGSLANALIGKNSLDSMAEVVPEISQAYYFTYVFFVILTLMTMFSAILNQSITEVRENIQQSPEVFGVMNILQNAFSDIFGTFFSAERNVRKSNNPSKKYSIENRETFDAPNILKLVRDLFGEKWTNEESNEEAKREAQKTKENKMLCAKWTSKDKVNAAYGDFFQNIFGSSTGDSRVVHPNTDNFRADSRLSNTGSPYLPYL